ncbi:MAG: deoxyribodipyrimidine photo-lyase [Cyanobacteriota bacterium]|nr:deoxyribodipyrimidine photo-lyase [Cyanobacteriota bacterium]
MNPQRILLWYRNSLRLRDREPLYRAQQAKAQIIPVYCFDVVLYA